LGDVANSYNIAEVTTRTLGSLFLALIRVYVYVLFRRIF
jgi:hypothetical protein